MSRFGWLNGKAAPTKRYIGQGCFGLCMAALAVVVLVAVMMM